MKMHFVTVGAPKLRYAREGFAEYLSRLRPHHNVRVTHLADKDADDAAAFRKAAGNAYTIALAIEGNELSSQDLATFLDERAMEGLELCWMIGGPDGLPAEVRASADFRLSMSRLTFPHDLAMVVLVEAVYRAGSILAGHPYHRA